MEPFEFATTSIEIWMQFCVFVCGSGYKFARGWGKPRLTEILLPIYKLFDSFSLLGRRSLASQLMEIRKSRENSDYLYLEFSVRECESPLEIFAGIFWRTAMIAAIFWMILIMVLAFLRG